MDKFEEHDETYGDLTPRLAESQANSEKGKTDLLLRFFDSEFFNEWIAVQYLHTSKSPGVQDYICNRIYTLPENGIEKYLSQLCITDLCSRSLRLSIKVHWYLQAAFEDRPDRTDLSALRETCEKAAVQGRWEAPFRRCVSEPSLSRSSSDRSTINGTGDAGCSSAKTSSVRVSQGISPLSFSSTNQPEKDQEEDLSSPRLRQNTFRSTIHLIDKLCDVSASLVGLYPMEARQRSLRQKLNEINMELAAMPAHSGVLFPMGDATARVVRVPGEEAALLNSRDKCPFMMVVEVIEEEEGTEEAAGNTAEASSSRNVRDPNQASAADATSLESFGSLAQWSKTSEEYAHGDSAPTNSTPPPDSSSLVTPPPEMDATIFSPSSPPDSIARAIDEAMAGLRERKLVRCRLSVLNDVTIDSADEEVPVHVDIWPVGMKQPQRVPSQVGLQQMIEAQGLTSEQFELPSEHSTAAAKQLPPQRSLSLEEAQKLAHERKKAVFGESWAEKCRRIRERSPFGAHPRWKLHSAIVKAGDDCRQELLALQLVYTFQSIYAEAGLPLWVRPFQVLVVSSRSAIIETVPNALSIHAVKARSPPGTSLRDHFCAMYIEGSAEYRAAQRRFVESLAAYSIIQYLLQVKDRHNGNILLDNEGHLIHIDFGFMLHNSPGMINFETAPFKLTRELLEVMESDAEGTGSELFDYFKVLCIQGFLATRKHADRIVCLVEMMQHSACPCFGANKKGQKNIKAAKQVVQSLRKRFAPGRPEEACVELVLGLISDSLDAWRTRQYDYYQRVLNGIL